MTAGAGSRLARLARREEQERIATLRAPAEGGSGCELCSAPIASDHRHLLDMRGRELLCVCRPCALLFDRRAAGAGHLRLVGDRRLRLDDFELDDVMWADLRLPVDMAFFFHSSKDERVRAYYPSPMGPTESLLVLEAWEQLEAANPVLRTLAPDVEALLVNRVRGARQQWIVPIDECYGLVGLIRTGWRGLTGGTEVWQQIAGALQDLDRRSRTASRLDTRETG
jgi:Family of unknown function (DUF5947)